MSIIMDVTFRNPDGMPLNAAEAISEKSFKKSFGMGKAFQVLMGQYEVSEDKSITSLECAEGITVFALEKVEGKAESIMAWHLEAGREIADIQLQFNEITEPEAHCEIYIIGGNEKTTEGAGCLLEKIEQAITGFFQVQPRIIHKLVNLNPDGKFKFVSANLQINGTLSYCYHN